MYPIYDHGLGQGDARMQAATAHAAGDRGMAISFARAERSDPSFGVRARAEILLVLEHFGPSSGEELVDYCMTVGIVPPDARAFGAVFRDLSRNGRIVKAGYCERRKGNGTAGGIVWRLAS